MRQLIPPEKRWTLLRAALLMLWIACIVFVYWFFDAQAIPVKALPSWIRSEVLRAGAWGPFIVWLAYLAITLIPFPTAALAIISGSVFGPLLGGLVAMIGLNVASWISFVFGRFFGRHFVHEHERGWVKNYNELMARHGFMSVFVMRLLLFPFDYVSLGSGMTRMSFRQYALGTLFGSIPQTMTLVVLGEAFQEPRAWFVFGGLLVVSFVLAFFVKRSVWAGEHVLKASERTLFE